MFREPGSLRVPRWLLVVLAAASLFGLSGCSVSLGADPSAAASTAAPSGTGSGTGATSQGTAPRDSQAARSALLKYAQCMRKNGINMPDPGANGGGGFSFRALQGANPATVQKAQTACRSLIKGLGPPQGAGTGQVSAKVKAAGLKFAACMRKNGVPNFPDPTYGAGGGLFGSFHRGSASTGSGSSSGGIDFQSPAVQKAFSACRADLSSAFGGGRGFGGGGFGGRAGGSGGGSGSGSGGSSAGTSST